MIRFSGFNIFTIGPRTIDALKKASERFDKRFEGTFIGRSANYMKNVVKDYKEVTLQVKSDMKAKPVKAAAVISSGTFLFYCLTHNPNEKSYRAKFVQCSNDVSLVSLDLVNPSAVEHLKLVQHCYNKDLIRYNSFGLFSIIWMDRYSDQCNMYENNCSYLKIPYSKFPAQVLDIGFLNIWWMISRKMLDYDVNYV